ncbi:MAG: flagellar hook protein FlgE [Gammaproteobacteria bacterium]|nr:flagellar hook protein FlgE [Gammaproteobacteria bacterium]MCW8908991.1 flagellar hook protein FlgE [Gammaproteobacteria bacterium]MCW9004567.1 flagellar hook protein FlgE [Gammaproteobacteria bacterium]MCW9055948.1 flagellar hook protein FlgE [Gammaproteobacteria bacterium]
MSFSISLSGLNAASSDLSVTSNNIANVGTTGFKGSRAEFADIFAASSLGSTSKAIGDGVVLSNVSQQFTQGNLEFTENTLDLAITGEGFYVMREQGTNDLIYTRAGAFNVNQNGIIANSASQVLQVFPVDVNGIVTTTSLSGTIPLQVPNTVGTPQGTTQVDINLSFPSDLPAALSTAALDAEFDAAYGGGDATGHAISTVAPNPNNYHTSTSATVFDSQGNSHILTMYFVMNNDLNNTWEARATMDGYPMPNSIGPGVPTPDIAEEYTGTTALPAFPIDYTAPNTLAFDIAVDGGAVQSITLNGGPYANSAALDPVISGLIAGATVDTTSGSLVITSDTPGAASDIVISNVVASGAAVDIVTGTTTVAGAAATNPLFTPAWAAALDFDGAGVLQIATSTNGGNIQFAPFDPQNGANPIGSPNATFNIDFTNQGNTITQEAQGSFSVQSLSQDGFATGRLSGLEIDDEGLVRASFTNGQTTALGKIALARFDNPQGLNQIGNTSWVETVSSGQAVSGEAGTGNFGLIQAGALETSNVDLTAQLVKLITAQRNFQANSKAIETANTITQTIINIR